MRTVHKWSLQPGWTPVPTFEGARIVHVATQNDAPCVWAEVNTLERECVRMLVTVGTGYPIPPDTKYVGTATDVEGGLVFHVYEPTDGGA